MRTTPLPTDPQQLQLMFRVARDIVSSPNEQAPNLATLRDAAVDLLDADGAAAHRLATHLVSWQASPREAADRFLGDLGVKMGLDKAGLGQEPAALNRIANLAAQAKRASPGLPEDVQLPPGELASTWDGQHPRLAQDFPQIVLGRSDTPGEIGLENLLDTLPEQIGRPPNSVSKDDLRARVTRALEGGVRPRDHLQPGGIVASELVAMLAGIGQGDHVVDLCAGEHGTSVHLAKNLGANVTSYEVSDAATAVARNKIAQQGLQDQISLNPVSVSRMQLPDDSVQAMVGNNADGVHYVADRDCLFERIHDALAPGGAFVNNAYIPTTKPEGLSEDAWTELKDGFTAGMGWQGVNPEQINCEGYTAQLEQAGFQAEDVEVIQLGGLYHAFHEAVMANMERRGTKDPWLSDWLERSNASGQSLGGIIRAVKR